MVVAGGVIMRLRSGSLGVAGTTTMALALVAACATGVDTPGIPAEGTGILVDGPGTEDGGPESSVDPLGAGGLGAGAGSGGAGGTGAGGTAGMMGPPSAWPEASVPEGGGEAGSAGAAGAASDPDAGSSGAAGAGGTGLPPVVCGTDPGGPGGSCPSQCAHCAGNTCWLICGGTKSCTGAAMKACPPGMPCKLLCTGTESCASSTVTCPDDFRCEVDCTGYKACEGTTVACSHSGKCQMLCPTDSSCAGGNLACGANSCKKTGAGHTTVSCGASCDCS